MRRPIAAMVILDVCTEYALRSAAHVCICLSCISCRACRAPTSGRGLGLVGVMGCSRNCQPKNPLQLLVGAWAWSARAYTINKDRRGVELSSGLCSSSLQGLVPIPSALVVMLPTRIGRSIRGFWHPRQKPSAHSCVRPPGWSAGASRCLNSTLAGKPREAMPVGTWKVSLRLVHDPAGMGSWVRPRRAGERLVADVASSTYIVVFLKADQVRLEVAALVLCTHQLTASLRA
ncbi:hypothetical protein V8C40DRAFT_229334 [Trichoderma camerunense]